MEGIYTGMEGYTYTGSKLRIPLNITYNPQPDITAYELSLLVPLFFRSAMMSEELDALLKECLRYLIIKDPNKDDK